MLFTAETRGTLEMQSFTPAYMKRWTYVRTILSEPKFLGCMITRFSHPWCSAIRYCNAMNVRASFIFHLSLYSAAVLRRSSMLLVSTASTGIRLRLLVSEIRLS